MKRLGIFIFYDPDGIVDSYVSFLLSKIRPLLTNLIIVCNGFVNNEGKQKLTSFTDNLIERPNIGFDGMALRQVLVKEMGWSNILKYDSVLVFNDTFFGPFYELEPILLKMESKKADLCGLYLLSSDEFFDAPKNFFEAAFYLMKSSFLSQKGVQEFFENLNGNNWCYSEAISEYEHKFIPLCKSVGCIYDGIFSRESNNSNRYINSFRFRNDTTDELIKFYGFPFLKRRMFYTLPAFSNTHSTTLNRSLNYIKQYLDYDIDMIWENVLRRYKMKDISAAMQLSKVILPCHGTQSQSVAIVVKTNKKHFVYDYCDYFEALDINVNIICDNIETYQEFNRLNCKQLSYLSNDIDLKKNINELDVDFIVYFDDTLLASDEKKLIIEREVQRLFFENLLYNCQHVDGVINEFTNEKKLGIGILPPPYNSSYFFNKIFIPAFWIRKSILVSFLENNDTIDASILMFCQNSGFYYETFYSALQAEYYLSNYEFTKNKLINYISQEQVKMDEYSDLNYFGILEFCKKSKKIFIYGAGIWGKRVLKKLLDSGVQNISGFIISDGQNINQTVDNYSVVNLSNAEIYDNTGIIVAVRESQKGAILRELDKRNIKNIFILMK